MTTTHVMKGVNPFMGYAQTKQAGNLQDGLTGSFTDAFSCSWIRW